MNRSHRGNMSKSRKKEADTPTKMGHLSNRPATHVQFRNVTIEDEGQRLDNFLFRIFKGIPKSHVYRIIRSGEVRVNKGRVDQTYRLVAGDVVRVPPLKITTQPKHYVPAKTFDVLYEDDCLLVINKPAGIAVHGGSGVSFGIIEQLRSANPKAKFLELVHRLDKETSGILVLAKKRSALVKLHEQIRLGSIDKRYQALVSGNWKNNRQHVRFPLLKYHTAQGERRVKVDDKGLVSHTIFNVLKHYGNFTLLEAELKTGRTHQIRVHLSSLGYAIVGDDKYGNFELNKHLQKTANGGFSRMFLHAYHIEFTHPETGQPIIINAPLPKECSSYLNLLQQHVEDKNASSKL